MRCLELVCRLSFKRCCNFIPRCAANSLEVRWLIHGYVHLWHPVITCYYPKIILFRTMNHHVCSNYVILSGQSPRKRGRVSARTPLNQCRWCLAQVRRSLRAERPVEHIASCATFFCTSRAVLGAAWRELGLFKGWCFRRLHKPVGGFFKRCTWGENSIRVHAVERQDRIALIRLD